MPPGGAAVLTSLVRGLSVEYATALVMTVIGAYTLIGGLGATFYVSYFNTAVIYIVMMIFIMTVYHNPENPNNPLGKSKHKSDTFENYVNKGVFLLAARSITYNDSHSELVPLQFRVRRMTVMYNGHLGSLYPLN